MKKLLPILIVLLIVSANVWAQKTATKFGYSWEYPKNWDKEKMDSDEIFLTPESENSTVTFVTIKSFDLRGDEDSVAEDILNFMMREVGTSDPSTFQDMATEEVTYNGVSGVLLSGSYLDDDFEFTDFKGLFIMKNNRKGIMAFGSVYDAGDMNEAFDRMDQVEAILKSTRKAN